MRNFTEQNNKVQFVICLLLIILLLQNCSLGIVPWLGIRDAKEISEEYPEEETEKGINSAIFHFPGVPQRRLESLENNGNGRPSFTSNSMYYGAISSILLTGAGIGIYQSNYSAYRSLTPFPPFLYYSLMENSSSTLPIGYVLLAQDRAKFSSAYARVESSSGIVNGGLGLFGFFVLFSHLNIMYLNDKDFYEKTSGNLPLYRLEKGSIQLNAFNNLPSATQGNPYKQDLQYNLQYQYSF